MRRLRHDSRASRPAGDGIGAADLRTTVHPVHVSDPVRRVLERLRTNCARARSFTVALRPAPVKALPTASLTPAPGSPHRREHGSLIAAAGADRHRVNRSPRVLLLIEEPPVRSARRGRARAGAQGRRASTPGSRPRPELFVAASGEGARVGGCHREAARRSTIVLNREPPATGGAAHLATQCVRTAVESVHQRRDGPLSSPPRPRGYPSFSARAASSASSACSGVMCLAWTCRSPASASASIRRSRVASCTTPSR